MVRVILAISLLRVALGRPVLGHEQGGRSQCKSKRCNNEPSELHGWIPPCCLCTLVSVHPDGCVVCKSALSKENERSSGVSSLSLIPVLAFLQESVLAVHVPSITPAFGHLRIRRGWLIRSSTRPMGRSKYRRLQSITFVRVIPTASLSSASCWLPARGRMTFRGRAGVEGTGNLRDLMRQLWNCVVDGRTVLIRLDHLGQVREYAQ